MYNKSSGFYTDEDDYVFLLDSDAATFRAEDGRWYLPTSPQDVIARKKKV
jgi:hypothetical protein